MKNRIKSFIENGLDPLGDEMIESLTDSEVAPPEAEPEQTPGREYTNNTKLLERIRISASVVLCTLLIAMLSMTVIRLPKFGTADTMMENEVAEFYVENSLEDTGALNIISTIILSYRGFDTLGESHVLFIAVCSVIILMRTSPTDMTHNLAAYKYHDYREEPHDDQILLNGAKVVVPLIIMFGIYIILNGNLSPGGGFSGGAVIGAGLILYLSVYGYKLTRRFMRYRVFRAVSCFSLVSYSCFKCYHFVTGFNEIESVFSNGTIGSIFSGGMLLFLNAFVGLVVACTMYAMFTLFRRGDF